MTLDEAIKKIQPLDEEAMEYTRQRWNTLGKPLHSLGRLEEMVTQFAGIYRDKNPHLKKKAVIVMSADNGVVAEGVTQTGQEVTKTVTENMTKHNATICILSSVSGADVFPVDVGIATDCDNPGVISRKIKYGTDNMAKGPAMSREEAVKAIEVGIEMVGSLKEKGYNILATGEMGIGNTTTSSAICSVLLNQSVEKVTGKGAGLSSRDLEHKIEVIRHSIEINHVNPEDPLDVLAKIGGLDIAGMVGCFIGGAAYHIPVFIDGFISSVAALIAIRLVPACSPYLFPSHCSNEPAGKMILDAIGKQPYILANMCLGEGTGAVMGFTIADYAFKAYWELPSFEQTNFGTYEELN
ncbi:MAG: nicotinate-nucleotide--dimethylbenzimidazole phosphoribosyltransferase [Lachnospiraceae bacterium]|nr:nicotinate-nucleotide--dimethylbenzimidazole phosphoribosyltransferase [Lachnospiraceae bacterium]MDY5497614.1 nicotinate-nucleotide--dimethylbenzimidazole phosphoribosyltransferase [Anaerobutyricum sp.]